MKDWTKKLARLFDIDASDPSKGIRIAPKQSQQQLEASLPTAAAPPPAPGYGVHIVNGRIVRESRHADSGYADWAQAIGPALTELEKKSPGTRVRNSGPPAMLADLEFAVIDTETTGGTVLRGHRITEIAIVRVNANGKVLHEYSTLVNPGRRIPREITAITHIDNGMVRAAPRFEDIADDVRTLLDGRVFVAHNAPFDWAFVSGELLRTTGRPLLGKKLCTVRLARKVVPEVRRRSLDSLCYYFNVPNQARHRAYGDARATAVVFRKMLDRVFEREIESWQQLEQLTLRRSQRRKRTAMPHGMEDV